MGNSIGRLRFKTGSSFAVAALGCITFARLLHIEPLSIATVVPFFVIATLTVAATWRGIIYWQAIRSLARSQ